jgi:hypothetical protein
MIKYPKVGSFAIIHYNEKIKDEMPYHGKGGKILVVAKGPGPRNVLLSISAKKVVVPRGNLK